jgi:hypothetical protein
VRGKGGERWMGRKGKTRLWKMVKDMERWRGICRKSRKI